MAVRILIVTVWLTTAVFGLGFVAGMGYMGPTPVPTECRALVRSVADYSGTYKELQRRDDGFWCVK